MSSSQWDVVQELFPLLDFLREPKDIFFDFDLNELESESNEDEENEASESVEEEDIEGEASKTSEMEDNEGKASESGEVENNKSAASESTAVKDHENEASQSDEVEDDKVEASVSDENESSDESCESNVESVNMEHAPVDGTMEDFNPADLKSETITSRITVFPTEAAHLHYPDMQQVIGKLKILSDKSSLQSDMLDALQSFCPLLETLMKQQRIIFDIDINEFESDSDEEEDNEGGASESGEVEDSEDKASQSCVVEDNESEVWKIMKVKSDENESNDERDEGTMEDFVSVETRSGMEVTITTRTYDFFKESIHLPERHMRTEYLGIEKLVEIGRNLEVFADGLGEENGGYVSICFQNFDGSCIVSVIDASGNQRFSQSYIMSLPEDSSFVIDKFISHKRLLSDPDELLPNGTLTLMIHASFSYQVYFKMPKNQPNILLNFRETSNGLELLLDSPLAKCLKKESNLFREIIETPARNASDRMKITESMNIPDDELWNFFHIGKLLMGCNPLVFDSIEQIFDMYLFADKYDIPFAVKTYVLYMHMYGHSHGTDEFWGKVDEYFEKEDLKELLRRQISSINESKIINQTGTEDRFRDCKKKHNFNNPWFFVDALLPYSSSVHRKLLYYNLTKTVIRLPNFENKEHDFYK